MGVLGLGFRVLDSPNMGVSDYRGPKYSAVNSSILIIRTPQTKVPPFVGNSHIDIGFNH